MNSKKPRRAIFKSKIPVPTSKPTKFDIRTHAESVGETIPTFSQLLARPVPLADHTNAQDAFLLADYAKHALIIMRGVVEELQLVRRQGKDGVFLNARDLVGLQNLRSTWNEHLRARKYGLWHTPPLAGGVTAAYSLATQIWLLVAHANVLLQESGVLGHLALFEPASSAYLSRNKLLLDTGTVMHYPLRTLVLAAENFVQRLDSIDRFHADYAKFVTALEHRVARFICTIDSGEQLNAAEWCIEENGKRRVSEKFIQHSMIWIATLYDYAENWCTLNKNPLTLEIVRVPAYIARQQRWFLGEASRCSQTAFLCRYARTLLDDVFVSGLRDFLRQFQLRPVDMDIYRLNNQMNDAHITSVRTHKFDYRSEVAHAYLYHLHFQRKPFDFVGEWLQWREGELETTRSGSLGIQGMLAQLAILFIWHTCIQSMLYFDFKSRCVMFHRDPAFTKTLANARNLPYPVIVQQFGRFSVLVPAHTGYCERVYDCVDILDALAIWSVWFLAMSGGKVDEKINLSTFLEQVYGEQQLRSRVILAAV